MLHDVVIVGAGPCALAVAARLCEPSPSALFTDTEHARFWKQHRGKNTIEKEAKRARAPSKDQERCSRHQPSIIALDAHSDQWMSSWRSKFEQLNITHLRSPLFFHPDPRDRDGLLAYAHFEQRSNELVEIPNVVGREISKHRQKKQRQLKSRPRKETGRYLHLDNRDRNDYFTPSSSLFDSYVDSIVQRYDLSHLVCHARVVDLTYDFVDTSPTKLFELTTSTGEIYRSRAVVLATGPSPALPKTIPSCSEHSSDDAQSSITHVFDISRPCLPCRVHTSLVSGRPTKIVIVGGGLTSAQLTDLLLSRYRNHDLRVHLLLRSKVKVKHFDVDLNWVTKLRNREMAAFWMADSHEERFEMLRNARGGGSMTPGYAKILKCWVAKGRCSIHEYCEISTCVRSRGDDQINASNDTNTPSDDYARLDVHLKSSAPDLCDKADESDHNDQETPSETITHVDHIIFATSTPPDLRHVPLLEDFSRRHPIENVHGLPVLNQDLMWCDGVPLFVTGALAGLRLGPGAGNLGGARLGAERIAWKIEDMLATLGGHASQNGDDDGDGDKTHASSKAGLQGFAEAGFDEMQARSPEHLASSYASGLGSRFQGLALLDTDSL